VMSGNSIWKSSRNLDMRLIANNESPPESKTHRECPHSGALTLVARSQRSDLPSGCVE